MEMREDNRKKTKSTSFVLDNIVYSKVISIDRNTNISI